MKQVIDIDYTPVNIKSTLESVETILKAAYCHVNNQVHQNSIYNYLETSNIIYEEFTLCNKCRDRETNRSAFDIKRQFIKSKYYITDTVFPFFRGLYCLRDSFPGSTYVKEVKQHEVSIYKEAFKMIYFLSGSIHKYDGDRIRSLFTDFEFQIILPELIAGLVQGLMTPEEEEQLLDLLRRDTEVAIFIDKLDDISKLNSSIEITPILPDFTPIIIWKPTASSLLKEYISMGFSMLLTQMIKKIKTIVAKVNMRSISDFRLIFELETAYESCVFNIHFDEPDLGKVVFTLESEDSVQIVPTYFNQEV